VPELPEGYRAVPPEDQKKAEVFFGHGRKLADSGNYEYSIEMFLQGLNLDPESIEAHKALRDTAMKRKVSGGKAMGMMEKMKLKSSKDEKQNMLVAEKLLAYEPGNMDHMKSLLQAALKAGYFDTVLWMADLLMQANLDNPKKPDFKTFILLKDTYKSLRMWKLATQACQGAATLKPDDMDLMTELKHLGAQETMTAGNYEGGGSFRESIRDMDKQKKLLDSDKDVHSMDVMTRAIVDAEAEYKADPNEAGKLTKFVDALCKTEDPDQENRAIELLNGAYERTKQFKFRLRIGMIKLAQLSRMERSLRTDVEQNPKDLEKRKAYAEFRKEKLQEELNEYQLWSENYPTEMSYKYQSAIRLFQLEQYDQAIPILQQARMDPKYKNEAALYLGRAFFEAQFIDEAVDTFKGLIDEYLARGDDRSKAMTYWYARALEARGDLDPAQKAYSQVAQWDFNYRDVQLRIKAIREKRRGNPENLPDEKNGDKK